MLSHAHSDDSHVHATIPCSSFSVTEIRPKMSSICPVLSLTWELDWPFSSRSQVHPGKLDIWSGCAVCTDDFRPHDV